MVCFQFLPDSKILHLDILIDCLLVTLSILKQMETGLKYDIYSLFNASKAFRAPAQFLEILKNIPSRV